MADRKQLEIRQIDIEKRFAEIGGLPTDDVTPEVDAELTGLRAEHGRNGTQIQALMMTDGPETPLETRTADGRDFRALIERSNVGEIFHVALHGGTTTGATAEMQKHYGLEVRSVPLAMLIQRLPDDAEIEMRRTNSPSDVGRNQQSIIPYVFPDSASAFLGLDQPSVSTGEAVFPVLTTAPANITTPAEGVAATESDGTFTGETLAAKRYQTFFTYSREDRAKFAMMDEALRENLSAGMASELDKQAISGTDGLLTATTLANNNVTTQTAYADYISMVFDRVDGRYASMGDDIRLVLGSGTYAHAGGRYRNNNVDRTALDRLMEISGGVRVSAHVPAVASTRQNALIRLGMRRDFVQPVWDSVELIPDEITSVNEGLIKVTAVGLYNQKLLRSDGFFKQQTQHA